jgi:signal transduction histidine kinase
VVAPASPPALLDEASSELESGLEELREIARGLHPAILGEHGLARALEALAGRLPVPVDVDAPAERLPAHVEDPAGGTGIVGLRDRAEAAGGTLSPASPPGRGTVVTAALPLPT